MSHGRRTLRTLGVAIGLRMLRVACCFVALGVAPSAATPAVSGDAPLDVKACIRRAMKANAKVSAAYAKIGRWQAKVDEVAALVRPQVQALGFVAPLFGAQGGFGLSTPYSNDLTSWGPYAHANARVVMPLSTFGRATAGSEAAVGRLRVEEQRVEAVRHAVRREVRRLFGLRLYALSMLPNLKNAAEIVAGAADKAREKYDEGTGEVTLADVMRLRYGAGEIARFVRKAEDGVKLTELGLKHLMGLDSGAKVEFSGQRLTPDRADVPEIGKLTRDAMKQRPEAMQLRFGRRAADALIRSEQLATMPVLFAAALGQVDWSPVRPSGYSAIGINQFNDWMVGAAIGLRFNWTPGLAKAKADAARSTSMWLQAKAKQAVTGIPAQVRKAHIELLQHRDLSVIARKQVKSTRKWMTFAAAAYAAGNGPPKDVLEGVGAYVLAKKGYYDHLLGAWQARADLELAMGTQLSTSAAR